MINDQRSTDLYYLKWRNSFFAQIERLSGVSFGSALWHFAEKKLKCPKGPRPNLPNVLSFYDQIGHRLSVFLSDCSGTSFLWYYIGKDAIPKVADDAIKSSLP
jgi:hypothetical protein